METGLYVRHSRAIESVVVSNTILRVFGDTSWTAVSANNNRTIPRMIEITNNDVSSGIPAFVIEIDADSALAGVVSNAQFSRAINPTETEVFIVPANRELAIVRAAVSTAKCTATEKLLAHQ